VAPRHKAGSLLAQDSGVALDALIEEVVEKVCHAHFALDRALQPSSMGTEGPVDGRVAITLNIDRQQKWLFNVASGAWRKMATSILSNALKFTTTGHITVSLDQRKASTEEDAVIVDFTVS
jgi:signal transduction histidine kinase